MRGHRFQPQRPARAALGWLVAFAFLILAPRILEAGSHSHGLVSEAGEACAACVIHGTPGAEPPAIVALAPLLSRFVDTARAPAPNRPDPFSLARPVAQGPPA